MVNEHSRPTLVDVGRLAGVSARSVSRVFNQPDLVNAETTALVLTAARRLGYRPATAARLAHRDGSTRTVGLMVGELSNPFYYRVAAGLEQELARNGYRFLLATTDDTEEGERHVADALLAQRVDALVIIPVSEDQSHLAGEQSRGIPIISIDRPTKNLECDHVALDNHRGAVSATRIMLARGHRRIAFLCNPASIASQHERVEGFRQAMREAHAADEAVEFLVDDRTLSSEDIVTAALDAPQPPTALLCGNNRMMIGALRTLRSRGDDTTALIGFDDFDTADILGASVVAYDPVELGREAARVTLRRLANPAAPLEHVILQTWTIERGSGERVPGHVA